MQNDANTIEIPTAPAPELKPIKSYLKWGPIVLRIIGITILVAVIAVLLPISAPSLMGMATYNITSGSMEPDIPVGSLVIVQPEEPKNLQEGDVIAFVDEDSIIVHRVVRNQTVEGKVFTKGDANAKEDKTPTPYSDVIGKVVFNVPVLGTVSAFLSELAGKFYAACFIIAGVLCCILANQLSNKRKYLQAENEEIEKQLRGGKGASQASTQASVAQQVASPEAPVPQTVPPQASISHSNPTINPPTV